MKKILCILLSVLMVISPAFIMGASAADEYVVKNPVTDRFDSVEEFVIENGDKTFYGFTYDFLYNSISFVDWTKLDIVYDENGTQTRASANSISLVRGDMNSYLRRVITNFFSGERLYTEEYATILTNFVGKMIKPGYVDKTITFGSNPNPNEEDFFELVADNSGLSDLIQKVWCDQPIEFKTFLTAFGVNLGNLFTDEYESGHAVATELLRAAVEKIIMGGPLDYIFNLLCHFSKNYSGDLYRATIALFSEKINAGKFNGVTSVGYTEEELKSVHGLFEIAFGNITDYRFMPWPSTRMSTAKDATESQLFLMIYFMMNYNYKDNARVIDGLAAKINNFLGTYSRYTGAGYDAETIEIVKANIISMIDCTFKGDVTTESLDMLHSLTDENVGSLKQDLLTRMKNSIAKLFRKIIDYFDYVFKVLSGEIEYGQPY